ncbi:NAD(P)H-binding protein [Kineococcus sp. NPDC059986]|uniref:NAD(P)H-binding protein n=1 Tax=Kineococcus sp. NPDC059986 TaxID=3155538 RepID=UPI00344C44EE
MSVLVVGARGAVGGGVVRGLLERGVEVVATSRRPEQLDLPASVRTAAADHDEPTSLTPALVGVDRVFLYADTSDPEGLLAVVAAAGVRHVVLLSSSAVTFPGAHDDFNGARFLRVEAAARASGLEHTFLRPGAFAANAAHWSWSVRRGTPVPLPYPDAVQAPVHERDVADVAVAALTGDSLTGCAPVLTGPERLTLRQQVDVLGQVVGRPTGVHEQTEEEAFALLSQHVPEVWARQLIGDWRRAVGTAPALSAEYERITGRRPRPFRTWVEDNVALFR